MPPFLLAFPLFVGKLAVACMNRIGQKWKFSGLGCKTLRLNARWVDRKFGALELGLQAIGKVTAARKADQKPRCRRKFFVL